MTGSFKEKLIFLGNQNFACQCIRQQSEEPEDRGKDNLVVLCMVLSKTMSRSCSASKQILISWMTESSATNCQFRQGLEPPSCDSFHKGTGPSCKYNFFHACRSFLYSLLMVKKNALLIPISKGTAQVLRPPLKFWLVQFWSVASQMVTAASWIFSSLTSWLIMRLDELKEVHTNEDERTKLHNEIVQAIEKSPK